MQKLWYYGRGDDISGPVTGRELAELANLGRIVLTDTIWLDGNEDGVAAETVKNLFPNGAITIAPEIAVVVPLEILLDVPAIALLKSSSPRLPPFRLSLLSRTPFRPPKRAEPSPGRGL